MELYFSEKDHVYRHGSADGFILEGVTSVIDVDTTWFTEEARIKGTHVHLMTHLYDLDDLDEENLDPAYQGYLEAYQRALTEKGITVIESELRVHSDVYLYGGTLDKLVEIRGERLRGIIDIKSGAYQGFTEIQTGAYAGCFPEPLNRYGLELRTNGTYRLWQHKDRQNFQEFVTLLNSKRIRTKYKLNRG